MSATCVCGSDLCDYRGINPVKGPNPDGPEYSGIVEEVGTEVTTIKPGQFVIGSFFASDNTCPHCLAGYQTSCQQGEFVGAGGAQARIIAMSRHESRQKLALEFGATDIVERGDGGVAQIKERTKGLGADAVLECVAGTSWAEPVRSSSDVSR